MLTSTLVSATGCNVRRNTTCTGFNASLVRARPALKLHTLLRQRQGRAPSDSYRPFALCQHGRLAQDRPAVHTPEVCSEEEVAKPIPVWQRLAGLLLKSTAVIALALALVSLVHSRADQARSVRRAAVPYTTLLQTFGGVSSAEAARSGGRMGGSSFSAARSGAGSFSRCVCTGLLV